jgi:hypothetical protein
MVDMCRIDWANFAYDCLLAVEWAAILLLACPIHKDSV